MLKSKKKIEFNNEELRIIRYALNDFRNQLLKENKYVDVINEVIIKLKNKMRVDSHNLGIMINALDKRKSLLDKNENTSAIDDLLLRLCEIYKNI